MESKDTVEMSSPRVLGRLVNVAAWGFVLNGIANTLFRDWLQTVTHFPAYEAIFLPVLEMVVGFMIVGRWGLPSIIRRLSRIGGLVYAWIGLGSTLLLPSSKAFQYFSVKSMTLLYLCFYLFSILVLMNKKVKTLFLSKEELLERSAPLEKIELDEAVARRVSFWVKLIAIGLLIDGFGYFFLMG